MNNVQNLKEMSREQLVELAGKQGLQVHPRAKEETIIKQIADSLQPQKPQVDMQHAAAKEQKPVDRNTAEEVEAAIADIKAKQPALEARYEGETWHFRCRGAEDSGNLNIPLRVIVMKARNVSRGRSAPMAVNGHFDSLSGVSPKNAYTNNVLAG